MKEVGSDILTDVTHYESTKFHPEFISTPWFRLLHCNTGQYTSLKQMNRKKKLSTIPSCVTSATSTGWTTALQPESQPSTKTNV